MSVSIHEFNLVYKDVKSSWHNYTRALIKLHRRLEHNFLIKDCEALPLVSMLERLQELEQNEYEETMYDINKVIRTEEKVREDLHRLSEINAVQQIEKFVSRLGVLRTFRDLPREVVEELIENGIYDNGNVKIEFDGDELKLNGDSQ